MQAIASSSQRPIAYGDFSHYWIRDVMGDMSIRRLTERYADEDVIAFVGFLRTDGRSVFGSTDPTLRPYKFLRTTT